MPTKSTTAEKLNRQRSLNQAESQPGPILYWMSRDQRLHHNWALQAAAAQAATQKQPLMVVFNLLDQFLGAQPRHFHFMLTALQELESELKKKGIPFYLLSGQPTTTIPKFVAEHQVGTVFTDFSPLRTPTEWKQKLAQKISVPLIEVDAHNIVPCWVASTKQEFAAHTLRPKLRAILSTWQTEFPQLPNFPTWSKAWPANHWAKHLQKLTSTITWLAPGEAAAQTELKSFIEKRLPGYADGRNDPNLDHQSNLSPYLHFGQLSAQHVANTVAKCSAPAADKEAFLEELIIRRELADNFCFYNPAYDQVAGFPTWAQTSLQKHVSDTRPYQYSLTELEQAQTHDPLWNAAQQEMVIRGKMHGYLRMYWAKKILEWTSTPATALEYALTLNDRYELDGRDPNGYTGVAWAIGGVHDRPWFERPIFGQIRYMSANGAAKKFKVNSYIKRMAKLA